MGRGDVFAAVMKDLQAMSEFAGVKHGGKPLLAPDERDYLLGAYQRQLEALINLKGALMKRDGA